MAVVPIAVLSAIVCWRSPSVFFALFPIVLVCGDTYPITGNLVLQAYDPILLAALERHLGDSVGFGKNVLTEERVAGGELWCQGYRGRCDLRTWLWRSWFTISLLGCVYGWTQLPANDWRDQLSIYFNQWNAIRIARGFAWGGLFFLAAEWAGPQRNLAYRFVLPRMRWSILAVGLLVIAERWTFESLIDFSREYRATGPFYSMHIGGQHLDTFLVLAIPFIFFRFAHQSFHEKWVAVPLVALSLYATLATMSRATIAIVLAEVSILILAVCLYVFGIGAYRQRYASLAIGGLMMLLLLGSGTMVWRSAAIQNRFAALAQDWKTRVTHWKEQGDSSRSTWKWIGGQGAGTFPTLEANRRQLPHPPMAWNTQAGGTVHIHPGWPIYLVHWLPWAKASEMSFELQGYALEFDSSLAVQESQQSVLQSYDSHATQIEFSSSDTGDWQSRQATIELPMSNSSSDASAQSPPKQPIAVSIFHARGGGAIAVNRIHVTTPSSSQPIIPNSDFEWGSMPWKFTSDDHLLWHAKNWIVHLIVEHGWVGVVMYTLLTLWRVATWTKEFSQNAHSDSMLWLLSLFATMGVGMFESLWDVPVLVALLTAVMSFEGPDAR